jgi:hypothetical protein
VGEELMGYIKYIVQQGDCISSIAYEHGLFPDTIWNDEQNSQLRKDRKNPNILKPGDEVYIRDREIKEESCASEQRHRFRRKGVPEKLQLALHNKAGEPMANEPVVVKIDGVPNSFETDSLGRITIPIPPNARIATIFLPNRKIERDVLVGHIDPADTVSGLQGRLSNLGYPCPLSGELDDETRDALKAFQMAYKLELTGSLDDATKAKIMEVSEI